MVFDSIDQVKKGVVVVILDTPAEQMIMLAMKINFMYIFIYIKEI